MIRFVPRPSAYSVSIFRPRHWLCAAIIALAAISLSAAGAHATLPNQGAIDEALKELAEAEQSARDNIPGSSIVKDAEDALDRATRADDETPSDDPAKSNVQKAKDDAQDAADKIREDRKEGRSSADQQERAKNYREALGKRRAAREKLKTLLAELQGWLRNRRGGIGGTREIEDAINVLRPRIGQAALTVPLRAGSPIALSPAAPTSTNGFLRTPFTNLLSMPGSFLASVATDSSENCTFGNGLGSPVAFLPISTDPPSGPVAAPPPPGPPAGSPQVATAPPARPVGEDCGPSGCGAKVPPVQTSPGRSVPPPVRKTDEDCGSSGCGAKVPPVQTTAAPSFTPQTAAPGDKPEDDKPAGAGDGLGHLGEAARILFGPEPPKFSGMPLGSPPAPDVGGSILDEIDDKRLGGELAPFGPKSVEEASQPAAPSSTPQTATPGGNLTGPVGTLFGPQRPISPGTLPGLPKVGVTSGGEYTPSPGASLEPIPAPSSEMPKTAAPGDKLKDDKPAGADARDKASLSDGALRQFGLFEDREIPPSVPPSLQLQSSPAVAESIFDEIDDKRLGGELAPFGPRSVEEALQPAAPLSMSQTAAPPLPAAAAPIPTAQTVPSAGDSPGESVTVFFKLHRSQADETVGPPVQSGQLQLVAAQVPDLPPRQTTTAHKTSADRGFAADPTRCTTGKDGECSVTFPSEERNRYGFPASGGSFAAVLSTPNHSGVVFPLSGNAKIPDFNHSMPGAQITGRQMSVGGAKFFQADYRLSGGTDQTANGLNNLVRRHLTANGISAATAVAQVNTCRNTAPGPWIEDMAAATAAQGDGLPGARISLRSSRRVVAGVR